MLKLSDDELKQKLKDMSEKEKKESMKNMIITNQYFKDFYSTVMHKFIDCSKFEDLTYINDPEKPEKLMSHTTDSFIPKCLFSQKLDTVNPDISPSLF